jgi:hypothetical protein
VHGVVGFAFDLVPTQGGLTLVLLASFYAIGRWIGGIASFAGYWLERRGIIPREAAFRSYCEWVIGSAMGALYLGIWLPGYLSAH